MTSYSIFALSGEPVDWSQLASKPTTLEGYGITDAVGLSGDQTIAGVKTFSSAPVLAALASDPASPVNGQVWHNSTTNKLKVQLNGTTSIVALSGESVAWSQITSAPTTLAGYGITDAQPLSAVLTATTASYTTAEQTKLAGIATGATANSSDATLLARANHTGTQAAGTITGLAAVATAGTFASLTSIPTTLSGYNITDAMGLAGTQTITGDKTFSGSSTFSGAVNVTDDNFSIKGSADSTKVVKFEVDGLTTGTTRTLTAPNASGTLALTSQLPRPYVIPAAGDYMMSTTYGSSGATGTQAGWADRMDLFQFIPPVDISIDQIACNVTTAVASAQGKIIVYSADASNGRPNALLTESAALDFSTTGTKTHSWSATLLQGLTYWLGMRHSSTATLSTWTAASIPDINGGAAVATTTRKILRQTLAFATGAPSTWTWSSGDISTQSPIALWLRKA